MSFHGKNFIGSQLSALGEKTFSSFDPKRGESIPVSFHQATEAEINQALELAAAAAQPLREASADTIAGLLDGIGTEIEKLGDQLIDQASAESGLGRDRLIGERARTVNQLRLFGALVKEGSYVDARIDTALPDRKPLPRPDIRRLLVPLGPVIVFGASNFPLAFSVAGGDTASALAARNPVVVKGHPAHPATSELVAGAIRRAVESSGLPEGTFSLVNAVDPEISLALVRHPLAKAVAFTGSEKAGRAIFDAASQRSIPIPAYVEMGSVNPVFILPGAVAERADTIAQGLTSSVNLGVGQFCTCPGLVFGLKGEGLETLRGKLEDGFRQSTPATMLHPGILNKYKEAIAEVSAEAGLTSTAASQSADQSKTEATPVLFETDGKTWLGNRRLAEEIFGPSAIFVQSASEEEMVEIAKTLPGTLTATIQGTPDDLKRFKSLIAVLESKAGRLIFNGYPTGVEVSPAMHHGGPYPATGDPKFTSVGTASIFRFLRPVCYQGFPDEDLPIELRNANARNIWRTVNGELTRNDVTKA
jgi:2,5-dioxopentanoate dehydrogenase